MIACVKSKVEASENKPWRLGALAVSHADKKLAKKEPFHSAPQVHTGSPPACVKSKVEASENKPWRLGALAVSHADSF